jgi:hypothetical protein
MREIVVRLTAVTEVPELNTKVTFINRTYGGANYRDYVKKTRIYVIGVEHLPELVIAGVELPEPQERGQDPDNDRAYDRYGRLYIATAKSVVMELFQHSDVLREEGIKLHWSRTTGPRTGELALIADRTLWADLGNGERPVDIIVTLTSGEDQE